jgi:hypothetical protein
MYVLGEGCITILRRGSVLGSQQSNIGTDFLASQCYTHRQAYNKSLETYSLPASLVFRNKVMKAVSSFAVHYIGSSTGHAPHGPARLPETYMCFPTPTIGWPHRTSHSDTMPKPHSEHHNM